MCDVDYIRSHWQECVQCGITQFDRQGRISNVSHLNFKCNLEDELSSYTVYSFRNYSVLWNGSVDTELVQYCAGENMKHQRQAQY